MERKNGNDGRSEIRRILNEEIEDVQKYSDAGLYKLIVPGNFPTLAIVDNSSFMVFRAAAFQRRIDQLSSLQSRHQKETGIGRPTQLPENLRTGIQHEIDKLAGERDDVLNNLLKR